MANALIQPYVAGTQYAVTAALHDPRLERDNRQRFGRDRIPELDLANALYIPAGRWPARAWILLRQDDYRKINTYATNLKLEISDYANPAVRFPPTLTFSGLTVVQARCVSRGRTADPNSIYLVELTDARGILWNRWFCFPTTVRYNVPAPAYPGLFYETSTDGGTPWTWDRMVGNLWDQMNTFLGAYPHLPVTPTGTPQGWSIQGTSAWDALNAMLDHLGMQVTCDLTSATPYGIVQEGATDLAFAALQNGYLGRLEDDLEYIDTGSGRVPGQVIVFFHRRNEQYGTEETIRKDALQWTSAPFYQVTVPAPARFQTAVGTHYLWDDFEVQYDVDGQPLLADAATAATIATERVTQYYSHIYSATVGFMKQVYTGVLPFKTGSEVDGVAYRMDFMSGRKGWVTELIRGPSPPWPEVAVRGY